MNRRSFLMTLSAALASAADRLPANKNVKWALGTNLWNSFPRVPFTDILDVMRDTGFIGARVTQFPQILNTYNITAEEMEREATKRGVRIITISFNGATDDPTQHDAVVDHAKQAMQFLQRFGAKHLVVFSPRRGTEAAIGGKGQAAFEAMCRGFNRIGEAAGEMGFQAGLHNHLGQMVQDPSEIDRCMELTDPKLFHFSPDTAHVHLAGGDVAAILKKHQRRLMLADYKDAKRAGLDPVKYVPNTYDLGDGEIDFPACHRVLKSINYQGWLCVDLDIARNGPRASYERCGAYVVKTLEPIYV
jgi:sugar phosphate isomerase/epimerase